MAAARSCLRGKRVRRLSQVVEIPYTPRPLWRSTIHPGLEGHRFSVVVAHRRFGKTVGTVNHTIKMSATNQLRSPQYAYIAPFLKQAKQISWNYLKYFTSPIPGIKKNESDLFVELPTLHVNAPGARIFIVGADHPDSLRGTYWDGVILDEYAQMKAELWGEVLRPALADRKGWAIFIGTPKGQNIFYDIYNRAKADPRWFTCMFRANESGVLPADELEDMKKDMTPTEIRQELDCDFTASAYNVLITIDLVNAGIARTYRPDQLITAPKVLGIDVARFGDDRSVFFRRQGLQAYTPKIFREIDNMSLASLAAQEINEFKPDAVFIDSGRGEGVIDRLRQLGYDVIEVPFGGRALKEPRYVNRRTEMWDSIRLWLDSGGSLPDLPDLKTDLVTPEFSFDAANRMKLQSKEQIKEKTGKSTDIGDALALTFAAPVQPRQFIFKPESAQGEYNPI